MRRREFLKTAAFGALASAGSVSFGADRKAKPNFVFIGLKKNMAGWWPTLKMV